MGRMSDLDLALRGLSDELRVVPWSQPTLAIHWTDDASVQPSLRQMWRAQVNRYLTVEWWCMGPSCLMSEEST